MQATGNELQPNNMNRDDDFCLREPSKPHICSSNGLRKWVFRFPYDGALHKVVSLMHIAPVKTPTRPFSRHMSKLPLLFPQQLLPSFNVPCCSFCSAFLLSFRNAPLALCSHLPYVCTCKYGPLQSLHHLIIIYGLLHRSIPACWLFPDWFNLRSWSGFSEISAKFCRYYGVTSHKIKILFIIVIIMGTSNPWKMKTFNNLTIFCMGMSLIVNDLINKLIWVRFIHSATHDSPAHGTLYPSVY